MAGTDVASMGSLVLQVASTIQGMGNNWYVASNAWKEFPQKVETLERKCKVWEAQLHKFGMSSDGALLTTLTAAKALLEAEKAVLEKQQNSCSSRCFSSLTMTVFPAKVGLSIQLAIDAFDAIPDFLKLEEECRITLQNRLLHRPHSLAIRNDAHNRYVHLEFSEREIHLALSKPEGPYVVLLHGGAGRGKSTLARHIAIYYNQLGSFDHVVFLVCGPKLEVVSKQLELLKSLGLDATPLSENGRSGFNSSIPEALEGALRCQKILLILDDLWDRDFLQRMVNLCGSGVKCFVTSQNANLCRGLNFGFTAVKIRVEREHSRKILASHVGFSNRLIPAHLEDIVDSILQKTEGHPLALALIATEIDSDRKNDLHTWESAFGDFVEVLRSEYTNHVDGDNYSRSFFSAMLLPIQRLTYGARRLLVLAHLCDGSSIPEGVAAFLYKHGLPQEGDGTFAALRRELESLELLKINNTSLNSTTSPEHRAWSIHSLQHLFIENEMSDEKSSMIKTLAGLLRKVDSESAEVPRTKTPSDEETVLVLCALYSHSYFAKKVASKLKVPRERFDELRKNVIEPISRLLGQPKGARWPAAAESSARLVLWTYICCQRLHDDAISYLLDFSSTQIPMLHALCDIATVEKRSLLNKSTNGLVKAVVRLFSLRDTVRSVNYAAAKAIMQLSINESDNRFLLSLGAVDEALKLLTSDFQPALQPAPPLQGSTESITVAVTQLKFTNFFDLPEHLLESSSNSPLRELLAVAVLRNLTAHHCEKTELEIIDYPGALGQLTLCLSKNSHPALQAHAARVFAHLSSTEVTKSRIVNFPKALEQLTLLLSKDADPELQKGAGCAFLNFSYAVNDEIIRKIVDCPGTVDQLVRCLSEESNPAIPKRAARALINLRKINEGFAKISSFPNALISRVNSIISEDDANDRGILRSWATKRY